MPKKILEANVHQILFYIGDFPIRSYGVVLSAAIFLATGVGYFLAKADGRGYEKLKERPRDKAPSEDF